MLCGKSEIQNDEATVLHLKNQSFSDKMAGYGLAKESSEFNPAAHSAMDFFAENDSGVGFSNVTNPESCTFKEKVQGAEIRIATSFLEHNISFVISSELIGLFQDMDPLVLEVKSVKSASTKISSISNKMVCAAETNRITEILQKESFSVYEDETNDRTQEKWLSLVVRYIEPVSLQLRVFSMLVPNELAFIETLS